MKIKTRMILLIITLICLTCVSASANSWGLSSQTLLNYVMKDKTWDDYSAEVEFNKKGISLTAAVMRSKYHSVLMVGRRQNSKKSNVWISSTAVFQPGEIDVSPKLNCTEDSVTLIYPEYDYEFVFTWDANQYPDGAFILTSAKKAGARLFMDLEKQVYRTDDQYVWQVPPITMEKFNISLFPDTAQKFVDMNRVYAVLSDASGFWSDTRSTKKAVKLPVYSAPDKNSYRAAKGKASVNLKGGVTLMATVDKWDLIEYEVSNRTHRTGWIEGNHLGDPAPISFTDVPVNGVAYLTDDPLCSQYQSFQGNQLRDIHLLAYLNPFYAYAKATTDDGKTVWGFVPIGLTLEMPLENIDTETMNELVGTWVFYSGGELTSEVLRLKEDGTCEMLGLSEAAAESMAWLQYPLKKNMLRDADDPTIGSWYVIDSLADNGCDKTLMIVVGSTYQSYGIYDLQPEETTGDLSMTLVYGEAGGTWARVHEEN